MHREKPTVILSVFLFVFASVCVNQPVEAATDVPLSTGPLVQDLVFRVIEGEDQGVASLINDDVDLIGEYVHPDFLPQLEAAENVEAASHLRNGYGYLVIKTDKYPLNFTAFRRAFAFALNKERICDELWDGLAMPQDSLVPRQNPFSIEGQLPYTYYDANAALGNQLLDAAGFLDHDSDGFREAPNGSDLNITIEVGGSTASEDLGGIAAEALQALGIDAVCLIPDWYECLDRLRFHGDFDMVYLGENFDDFEVDWLAYEYWSDYADEPYWNFPCWRNASYDSWREQLLHATDYDKVYEAAAEMQKIWVHSCPAIVCYQNVLLSAYRTDTFEGYVNDALNGVPSWWTNYKVHLKDSLTEPPTGQFRWSTPLDPDTFNLMLTYSVYTGDVLNNLYDSLIRRDPEGNDIPWLAKRYVIQAHDDNGSIPEGHMRIVFDIVSDAVWTDHYPLTAQDVAYTLNYFRNASGCPYGTDLTEMTAAYSPTNYSVVVEFDTESYWHLHTIGYKPIIPKHVFETIGPSGWDDWDPDWDELVTSGPFIISAYVDGEYTKLSYNPLYFHAFSIPPALGHPADLSYAVNSTGNTIVWSANDTNPALCMVYRNNTLIEAGSWTGDNVTINIDGLAVGTYNFTVYIVDSSANYANDTVWVHVYAPTTITTTTTTATTTNPIDLITIAVIAGAAAVVILIVGILLRSKRGGSG